MSHVRIGKIARLPFALREQVNQKLLDNIPATRIIAWLKKEHADALKAADIEDISESNVSRWRSGGFKEWLRYQERLEEIRIQREFAFQIIQQNDGSIQTANLLIAAGQIYEILQEFDIRELKEKLIEKPELYPAIVSALGKLSQSTLAERKLQLEFTKYQDRVAEQKRKLQEQLGAAKQAGLTPETIAKMEEALNLL